jgi:hypothetical protein
MPHTNIDTAKEAFSAIVADVNTRLDHIETEADARINIVNRLLTDVLLWPLV